MKHFALITATFKLHHLSNLVKSVWVHCASIQPRRLAYINQNVKAFKYKWKQSQTFALYVHPGTFCRAIWEISRSQMWGKWKYRTRKKQPFLPNSCRYQHSAKRLGQTMCLLTFRAMWSQRQAPTDPDIWAFKALNPRDLFPPARQNTAPPTSSAACACKCPRECLYANISLTYCCFAMQQSEKKMERKVTVAYSGLHSCFCLRMWETVLTLCCFVWRFDFEKH